MQDGLLVSVDLRFVVHPRVMSNHALTSPGRSHFDGSAAELIELVQVAFLNGEFSPGSFNGTCIVFPSQPHRFCRRGEVGVDGVFKMPAQKVEVVVWSAMTLALAKGRRDRRMAERCTHAIVSIRAA